MGQVRDISNKNIIIVYVCTFDARQYVVFITKLFEFEFELF